MLFSLSSLASNNATNEPEISWCKAKGIPNNIPVFSEKYPFSKFNFDKSY